MFTRSSCLSPNQCEAKCETHKRVKKRSSHKSTEIVIPYSGKGLVNEIEFSEDEDYILNNSINAQKLNCLEQNGINGFAKYKQQIIDSHEEEEEEEEEVDITIVRRVTNIFRTTINHTSKLIDSMAPNKVNRVSKKYPVIRFLWLLLLCLSAFVAYYLMNRCFSSQPSDNTLEGLTSDSSNYAINQLVKELKLIKDDINDLKKSYNVLNSNQFDGNERYSNLNKKVDNIEDFIINVMKNCCKNETNEMLAIIDSRLAAFMALMLNENEKQSLTPSEAAKELKLFIKSELSETNQVLKANIEQKLMQIIERVEQQSKEEKFSAFSSNSISIDEVKSLIYQALAIYDADKTGQPDFALEPAGGTVINTRCSETFDPYGVQYKIFGMPVWSSSISPRAVIQPTISPGECWAFRGSQGYLVMKLSQMIVPTAFSYEHIPKQISRDGNINSAPKEFQVRGLDDESDTSGHLLGNYIYEDNDIPMQHFLVQDPNPRPFQFIELVILSNHGHEEYTCLYRFRVHGKRVNY